uniref:HD domain-containing protein n=1 Tax=viral metagenome TaxID=1070528 RepID=A0A6C0J2P0_9ZZZZ
MIKFTEKQNKIIEDTEDYVSKYMENYDISHDFNHIIRVKNMATTIAISEDLLTDDIFIIQLGALMHDIADHKYCSEIFTQENIIRSFYEEILSKNIIDEIVKIACNTSLSKEYNNETPIVCKKLYCVQDADRIDSLGSIGISRYFAYGLVKNTTSIDDIIKNLEFRTNILMKYIKTSYAKAQAEKKYAIIQSFIEDYKNSV